jgi:RES domain-containing protein
MSVREWSNGFSAASSTASIVERETILIVWRIARQKFQGLDGEGARLNGGRWNSEGRPVVYASSTLSLAALEYLVHVEPLLAPSDLVAIEIHLPDDAHAGAQVEPSQFPSGDWQQYPAPEWEAELGDMWVDDGTFLWLGVPSVIVPQEYNILINPRHARSAEIRVLSTNSFGFDHRLFKLIAPAS